MREEVQLLKQQRPAWLTGEAKIATGLAFMGIWPDMFLKPDPPGTREKYS